MREILTEEGELIWAGRLLTWGEPERWPVLTVNDPRNLTCHLRFCGQYEDEESGLYYNRFRYYDNEIGQYLCADPLNLSGGFNPYGYVHDPVNWIDPYGLSTVTVGRWMSPEEFQKMRDTGKVVQSTTGTTHVGYPANINAFGKQAKPRTVYVEFDVPEKSLIKTNDEWAKIVGPDSLEGRLAKRKGLPIPEMPEVTNMEIRAHKTTEGIMTVCKK